MNESLWEEAVEATERAYEALGAGHDDGVVQAAFEAMNKCRDALEAVREEQYGIECAPTVFERGEGRS